MYKVAQLFLLTLVVWVNVAQCQTDTSSKPLLTGFVYNQDDSLPLAGVHLINLTTLKGTVTNKIGHFTLTAGKNDRVLVSYLGFEVDTLKPRTAQGSEDFVSVYLQPVSYMLPIFQVLSIQTFEEFEKAFLALQLPEKKINLNLPLPGSYQSAPPNTGAAMIAIPVDFSYFSKKSVELRKYKRLLDADEQQKIIYARYNPQIIELVTGVRNEKQVNELMDYCAFSDDFIRGSEDYDLYVAIARCYESYKENKEE